MTRSLCQCSRSFYFGVERIALDSWLSTKVCCAVRVYLYVFRCRWAHRTVIHNDTPYVRISRYLYLFLWKQASCLMGSVGGSWLLNLLANAGAYTTRC